MAIGKSFIMTESGRHLVHNYDKQRYALHIVVHLLKVTLSIIVEKKKNLYLAINLCCNQPSDHLFQPYTHGNSFKTNKAHYMDMHACRFSSSVVVCTSIWSCMTIYQALIICNLRVIKEMIDVKYEILANTQAGILSRCAGKSCFSWAAADDKESYSKQYCSLHGEEDCRIVAQNCCLQPSSVHKWQL